MKFTSVAAATLSIIPLLAVADLKDQQDKVSYSIGADIGGTLKRQGIEVKPEVLAQGLKDAIADGKMAMTPEEMQTTMQTFQQEMMVKMQAKRAAEGAKNKEASAKYLEENKKKEGVKTTASGLQYKIVSEGKGDKPKASDIVVTHYRGTTIDGKEFDSSYKRNEPAEFPLSGVIPGWTEGLQLMPVGSKFQFVVPAELAYGDQAPPEIGPAQTLIFDVELISIKAPEAAPAGAATEPAAPAAEKPEKKK